MLQSNSTSKIVVGVGLAVVCAVGVSVFAVRVKQEQARQGALYSGAIAADRAAPAPDAAPQSSTDATTSQTSAPTAEPTAAAPTAAAPAAAAATDPATGDAGSGDGAPSARDGSVAAKQRTGERANRRVAGARSGDRTARIQVASADADGAISAERSETNEALVPPPPVDDSARSPAGGSVGDTQRASDAPVQDAAAGVGAAGAGTAPVDPDRQITVAVKSEIDTAAPHSNVEVTTVNGVVALTGSVPTQDAVELTRLAAERVAGVKAVDSSALVVGNQ